MESMVDVFSRPSCSKRRAAVGHLPVRRVSVVSPDKLRDVEKVKEIISFLRKQRVFDIGEKYEKLHFNDVCMDGFSEMLLTNLNIVNDDDKQAQFKSDINHGTVVLQNGMSHSTEGAEYTLLKALHGYRVLHTELNHRDTQKLLRKRIRNIVGVNADGENFKMTKFNVKDPRGMLVKTFIRRKRLNDAIRTTIICSSEEERQIRENLERPEVVELRENGLLCVKDDLHSKKTWPVLKLIMPGVSYEYMNEQDKKEGQWTRFVYGVEVHITGRVFWDLKKQMHSEYDTMRIDSATDDFLDLRPFQMGNINLIAAFCKAMSKTNDADEYIRVKEVVSTMRARTKLYKSQGIVLEGPSGAELPRIKTELVEGHYKEIISVARKVEQFSSLLDEYLFGENDSWSDYSSVHSNRQNSVGECDDTILTAGESDLSIGYLSD